MTHTLTEVNADFIRINMYMLSAFLVVFLNSQVTGLALFWLLGDEVLFLKFMRFVAKAIIAWSAKVRYKSLGFYVVSSDALRGIRYFFYTFKPELTFRVMDERNWSFVFIFFNFTTTWWNRLCLFRQRLIHPITVKPRK